MELISSVNNDKIKFAVKVATSAKHRKDNALFFLEGLRLCCDANLSGVNIMQTFVSEAVYEKQKSEIDSLLNGSKRAFIVTSAVANKLSLTKSTQGVFCVCQYIENNDCTSLDFKSKYIALENVQDPSNLGAIARTAEALGLSGLIMQNCCDYYNPKAQRASMGSLLRVKLFDVNSLLDTIALCQNNGMNVYATTPDSSAKKITDINLDGGVICVIGNEGNGVSDEVFEVCEKVTIPMLGRAESLNAATAATITMWEMMR